jgi:hypothetical protein
LSGNFDALEESFSNVRLVVDGAGRLHAAWQTNESEGYGQAVYYVRSLDGGKTWSAPIQMGYRAPGDFDVGLSSIGVRGSSEVRIIYNAGTHPIGRYERVSQDGGATWSDRDAMLTEMEGLNGFLAPLVDSAGQLHLVIDMRTRDTQVVGIYYTHWAGTGWSKAVPLATDAPYGPSAHYTAATVRLGNELHVVWTQLSLGEIWYIHGTLPGVAPLPAAPVSTTRAPKASALVTATEASLQSVPTAQPASAFSGSAAPASVEISGNPLLYSVGAPALLVLCSVAVALLVLLCRRK